jgi:hypothetical protein
LEIIESLGPNSTGLLEIPITGETSALNLGLTFRGIDGFENNFKQLTCFSEEFLRKIFGTKA